MRNFLRKLRGTHGPTIIGRSLDFFRRHHDELSRGVEHCREQINDNGRHIARLTGENMGLAEQVRSAETMKMAIAAMLSSSK